MVYQFGVFELDLNRGELRAGGIVRALEPQVFALLALLVEHRERLVSKDEIFETVWDGRIVSDSALASRVKSARKALGDNGQAQRFIKTIHGRGLRFVADVSVQRDDAVHALAMRGEREAGTQADSEHGNHARPSIAVLPFGLIGDAGVYATIAEGLPHELITELARLRWLLVIARGSSFRLCGQDLDLCEVGRLLDVRYCLTGSVEVTNKQLAIGVELVDTRSGQLVWSERYSGSVDDIHTMRAEIRSTILGALEIQIPLHEATDARLSVSEDLDAWSAYHLGLQHIYRFNRADNRAAAALFGQAVSNDPGFARAHAGLSFVHFQNAFLRQTDDVADEIRQARACAQRGLEFDPLDPFVNFTMGRSFWLEGDLDRALAWIERSTSLSPNYAQGIYAQAWTETLAGNGGDGRKHVDFAMRLSPLDPLYYAMLGVRGFIHMLNGEYAEAAHWTDRAARSPGAHVLIAMIASVAQLLAGDTASAEIWASNVRQRKPALTSTEFFASFPLKPPGLRAQVAGALKTLGF